ncbi:MAG TPA: SDR family NAD(P)-dependent oxidoreductase [Longimicrobiaceae bacterium]|nr:SDR family NAD(P)-dependent oxidoreductase [Longimicrobiaceae bacterium]
MPDPATFHDADLPLAGCHAVVTGGGRGIGAAIARELARLGAAVTVMGRGMADLRAVAEELASQPGTRARAVACDVTDAESVARAFAEAVEAQGAVGVLVNNAGASVAAPFAATDRATWDGMLAVNLTGAYLCTQAVLPAMLQAGRGRVVNVASTAGLRGYSHTAAYCAAKHGLIGLTRALAVETARKGITVNAVCPGYTDTDMAQGAIDNLIAAGRTPDEARMLLLRGIPRGVLTQPHEVAAAVGWLCSPAAQAVTGVALPIAGGEVT